MADVKAHLAARASEKEDATAMSTSYKMFLVSCAAGSALPLVLGIVALAFLPNYLATAYLALLVVLTVIPLKLRGKLVGRLARDMCMAANDWFSIRIICDEDKFNLQGPYVIGLEPHGVLPTALPSTCNGIVHCLPPSIGRCHTLATSTVFHIPVMRHIWYAIDIRPASRSTFSSLLADGASVALSPGGVTECLYMAPGTEVAYLRRRLGFIRIALQHGAPLCPSFAFGQTACFHYLRPGPPLVPQPVVKWLASVLGFAPMLIWGKWFTMIPFPKPNTVVLGNPIELPRIESPSNEECQKYLDMYIQRLTELFYKHRAEAGYPDTELRIM